MTQSSAVTSERPTTATTGPSHDQTTKQKEVFYSPALEALIAYRKELCEYSFKKAHDRLEKIRSIRDSESAQVEENRTVLSLYINSKEMNLNASQFADERPLTTVRYSASGTVLSSASLNHSVKLWDANNLSNMGVLRGHSDRVTQVAWHPESGTGSGERYVCFAVVLYALLIVLLSFLQNQKSNAFSCASTIC